jgi:hypothetical protein
VSSDHSPEARSSPVRKTAMPNHSRNLAAFLVSVACLYFGPRLARGDEVQVAICEGISLGKEGSRPQRNPDDRYRVPALGIARIPAKYSARGVVIDRPQPFVIQAKTLVHEKAGRYRLILRSRSTARLEIDGQVLAETKAISRNSAGHESVPDYPDPEDPRWRAVATGDQEIIVPWVADGQPHEFLVWAVVGESKLRPETGELSVSLVAPGSVPVLIGDGHVELSDAGWTAFADSERLRLDAIDGSRRHEAAKNDQAYWFDRHRLAQSVAGQAPELGFIDRLIQQRLDESKEALASPADDAAFFRRLALDTIGVIPDSREVEAFLADTRADKRSRAIDARLADPRWADGWMGYWQDVLAENPGILKPTLNNTGPFRRYLHDALEDNLPFDRFVTELIRMEGSIRDGGPAGFAVASENDAPLAAKAHIVGKAFLAVEMKCARCHDAPTHPYDQADLFGLAGLLGNKAQVIPASSTVKQQEGGRAPAISVSLKDGDKVEPRWSLSSIAPASAAEGLLEADAKPRERLAALVTSPRNPRFAAVIVNRMWKRYIGVGLVEPVDDWDNGAKPSHPAVLEGLAIELIRHDYDLKHVARVMLNSRVYQSSVRPSHAVVSSSSPEGRLFAAAVRRRMTAEQLIDSMFAAVGKPLGAEELNLDPDGRRPPTEFLNLGVPRRAWQFTSTSNERDRPALSLPVTQTIVDVLQTFGWRPSRPDPITVRDDATNPLQPAILANGVVANRVSKLSDQSAITELCLMDQSSEALIGAAFLRILSRPPSSSEVDKLVAYLGDTYKSRIIPGAKKREHRAASRRVSWSNHLSPEASKIQLDRERAARLGEPATERLTPEFRERMEDIVWALINSPEFLFLP